MRLFIVLLAATAFTFFANGNALSTESGKVATLTSPIHSMDDAPNAGKRFLRVHKSMNEEDEINSEVEERGGEVDLVKMLRKESYRLKIFKRWNDKDISSFTVFDEILDVASNEKYRALYNAYAAYHNSH